MKGQLNSLEPIMIVIVLGLIAVLGLMFYIRVTDAQVDSEEFRKDEEQAVSVLKIVSTIPELSCPRSETVETYCIDYHKAIAFSVMMTSSRDRLYYRRLFGDANVSLWIKNLETGTEEEFSLYDGLGNASQVRTSMTYFTVYNSELDARRFATITVAREVG